MNVLIALDDGVSMCTFNGIDYPVVAINDKYVSIACSNENTCNNISMKTGGDNVETPNSEFPYEVRINLSRFDRIIEARSWGEIINKYIIKE